MSLWGSRPLALAMSWWIDSVLMKVILKPLDASFVARLTNGMTWPCRGYVSKIAWGFSVICSFIGDDMEIMEMGGKMR